MEHEDKMMKLKPCPFCGSDDIMVASRDDFYAPPLSRFLHGGCRKCLCDVWETTEDETDYDKRVELWIEKWNRRAK